MSERAPDLLLIDITTAMLSAEKRLEGMRLLFEAFAFAGNSEVMERYRAEAHAALDALLDAKASQAHRVMDSARRSGRP